MSLAEFIIAQIINLIVSLVGALVTLAVANGLFDQSWDFLPVYGAWFLIIFLGIVWFTVSDGEFDLFG